MAVIKTFERILQRKPLYPLMAEHEKWSKIQEYTDQIQSQISVFWQKSHTNETTIPATLNILADKLAEIPSNTIVSNKIFRHQNTQYSDADLKWKNIPITSKLFDTILHQISRQRMKRYLCKKFHWSRETYNIINWTACEKAIKSRSPHQSTQIHKIIYKWAPLNKRLHDINEEIPINTCVMCPNDEETIDHFLSCPNWISIHEAQQIHKSINKLNIHPIMKRWIITYLKRYKLVQHNPPVHLNYPTPLIDIVKIYQNIQWLENTLAKIDTHAFLFGFIPTSTLLQPFHSPALQYSTDANSQLISICHDIILIKWKNRNDKNHQHMLETSNIIARNKLHRHLLQPSPVHPCDTPLFTVHHPHQIELLDIQIVRTTLHEIEKSIANYKVNMKNLTQQVITRYFSPSS